MISKLASEIVDVVGAAPTEIPSIDEHLN